jgi:hypothetical protein
MTAEDRDRVDAAAPGGDFFILTEKGRHIAGGVARLVSEVGRELAPLSKKDSQRLVELLQRLVEASLAAPEPPPKVAYRSDVSIKYEATTLTGPANVLGIDSPLDIVLTTSSNRRAPIRLGGVAIAPGISADEAERALTRMLLGQMVRVREGPRGHLIFFQNADGAWNFDGTRVALANARLVHDGIYVPDLSDNEFGDLTDSVRDALENNPRGN